MHILGLYGFLIFTIGVLGELDENDMEMTHSLVKKMTAVCGKDGIRVSVRFESPFTGVVYSYGHYDTPGCVFINKHDNNASVNIPETKFRFLVPADQCGTIFHDPGSALNVRVDAGGSTENPVDESDNEVYMENTVMFQRNHYIQEQGDLAQRLRCVWKKEIRRPLHATLPLRGRLTPTFQNATESNRVNENSNFGSAPSKQPSLTKRFQPKGQVESISYGRRSGKSMDYSPIHHFPDKISMQSNPNFTALAYKAEDNSRGATVGMQSLHSILFCSCSALMVVIVDALFRKLL